MLHRDSFIIDPATFELIQKLQSFEELNDFVLVGGTSLALQIGHRYSIDIDLCSQSEFDVNEKVEFLESNFENIRIVAENKNSLSCVISGVKVDFISHRYPYVKPILEEEGIRYLGKEDIAAFIQNAIVNSGKRLKDFLDIFHLLGHYTMRELASFYTTKYTKRSALIAVKALGYFDEIDPSIDVPIVRDELSLESIKERIETAISNPDKVFKGG